MFPDQRRVGTIFCYPRVLLVASSVSADVASPERQPVDIDSFSLRDYRGKLFSFSDDQDSPIVVLAFLGTECPLAKLYGPRLQEIADRYSPRGVVVFGIFSNQQDAPTEIGAYARRHDIKFPLLKDLSNALADRVGAERTPEVVVLDARRVCR